MGSVPRRSTDALRVCVSLFSLSISAKSKSIYRSVERRVERSDLIVRGDDIAIDLGAGEANVLNHHSFFGVMDESHRLHDAPTLARPVSWVLSIEMQR